MTRFAGALVCLLATVSASQAMNMQDSLQATVKAETNRIPSLRKQEMERKNVMQRKLASMAVKPEDLNGRELANYNNANYNNANQYNNANNANNYQYANYQGSGYQWDEYMDEYDFGFDITNYAIKYTQCATVQTYSDNLAEDEYSDTVLAAQRFALFRLCPADQCSDYSNNGCASNYGEYLVSLDQFLMAMLEYQESRVAGYCEYCQGCASIEAAKSFWATVYNTREYALAQAQTSYQNWYTSFLENYNYNQNGNNDNGDNADGENANGNGNGNYNGNALAQQYYTAIRNGNNYANQYANYNYANSNSNSNSGNNNYNAYNANGQGYGYNAMNGNDRWYNQNMWDSQRAQQQQSSNQASWASMGSPSGTFYGRQIMNGYYDGDGVFYQEYGYFNGDGDYVSLEDDEIAWDETLWGEQPDGWDGVTEDTESCSYTYSGSCYNQYDACMQILEDEQYRDYQYQNAQNGGNQQAEGEGYERRSSLKDFVECVEVYPVNQYGGNTDYANYQYASQNGYNNQAQQNNYDYDCGGNEYCEQQRQYRANQYAYARQQDENRRYFVGPHCGSNNKDISLAVYKDEYCSVQDTSKTVEEVLGYSLTNSIDLFPSECMNCMDDGTAQPWYEDEEVYALEPMCSMLYQFAGKCNKNLEAQTFADGYQGYQYYMEANAYNNANNGYNNANEAEAEGDGGRKLDDAAAAEEEEEADQAAEEYNQAQQEEWDAIYQSEAQAANEEAVCTFIESLVSNTYNENGEVSLTGSSWSNPAAEFIAESKAMNPALKAALVITALAALAMAIAACVLHSTLARKNIPWKPRRSKGMDPTEMARQNSGITMGRSRSGPGNNPLL